MKLHLETGDGTNLIRAYGPGYVVVNRERYTRSLVVTPDRVVADWPPQGFAELHAAHFAALCALEPEVVLFGTGASLRFPPPALLAALIDIGVGVEVMDTAAACRTYNILVSEGRRVIAALFPIPTAQNESIE